MIVTPRNEYRIGDSLKLMPELVADESVDLILTDPPFGWNYRSNRARTEAGKVRNQRLINDHTLDWYPQFLSEGHRVLKNNCHCYVFCDWRSYSQMYQMVLQSKFNLGGVIVWNKGRQSSGDLQSGLGFSHEWIMFLTKGRRRWPSTRPLDVVYYPIVKGEYRDHPTQKPIPLLRFLIELSTEANELVLDPYAGSFSTARACKSRDTQTGDFEPRDYLCMEIDPQYEKFIKRPEGMML